MLCQNVSNICVAFFSQNATQSINFQPFCTHRFPIQMRILVDYVGLYFLRRRAQKVGLSSAAVQSDALTSKIFKSILQQMALLQFYLVKGSALGKAPLCNMQKTFSCECDDEHTILMKT